MLKSLLAAVAALIVLTGAIAGDSPDAAGEVREEFVAAMQRIRLHQPDAPDSAALQAYAIYDYLLAARLRRDLAANPGVELDAAVDTFIRAHPGEPVTRALRRDWLASLASRQRWDWFLPRSEDVQEPELVCDRLAARLAMGAAGTLAADALARWSLPQRQPVECDPVFAWLRAQNLPTPALAEGRTRAALALNNARLAREFAADLPPALAAPLLDWAQLLESPKAALEALADDPDKPVEAQALTAGFDRLARIDSAAAAALLPRLLARPDSSAAVQSTLRRAAALGAAYDHAPGALAAFNGFELDPADAQGQEWRVRAALWVGDYAQALGWIERMPPALSAQPRWRYWRARAVEATAGDAAAAPLFAAIAGLRDYYGYLAADRLRQPYRLNDADSTDDTAAQSALAALPALTRAHALFDCDFADDAAAEWNTVFSSGSAAAQKIQGAHLATRWQWYAEAITILAQAGEWDDLRLRYPRPYPAATAAAAALTQLPQDWILAVMRQESLFRKDAVSRADARGLMQMLRVTAVGVARRWHLPAPGPEGLFDPSEAIPLGAAHLRELLDRYGGQLSPSLAAYNAGAGAVARWLPPKSTAADVWIENIPYNETRGYVQHILEHIVAFAWVREAPLPRLEDLLPPVEPGPAGGAEHAAPQE